MGQCQPLQLAALSEAKRPDLDTARVPSLQHSSGSPAKAAREKQQGCQQEQQLGQLPGQASLAATDFADLRSPTGQPATPEDLPDLQNEAVLRIEYITGSQMKALIVTQELSVLTGLFGLGWLLVFKHTKDDRYFMRTNVLEVFNTVAASICVFDLLACLVYASLRIWRARCKRWSRRRRRLLARFMAELFVQTINATFYLAPNVYLLTHTCGWFDKPIQVFGGVRWTCWNVLWLLAVIHGSNASPWKRPGQHLPDGTLVLDAPWRYHVLKLPFWAAGQTVLILFVLYLTTQLFHGDDDCPQDVITLSTLGAYEPCSVPSSPEHPGNCRHASYSCGMTWKIWMFTSMITATVIALFGVYLVYILRALHGLRAQPYQLFRMANVSVRLQLRMRLVAIAFFALSVVMLWFLQVKNCSSYLQAWLGLFPCQMVATTLVIINVLLYLPEDPAGHEPVLQTRLQEYAWTEAAQPEAIAARGVPGEPMFCFETAIKCFYWSSLVYSCQEHRDAPPSHAASSDKQGSTADNTQHCCGVPWLVLCGSCAVSSTPAVPPDKASADPSSTPMTMLHTQRQPEQKAAGRHMQQAETASGVQSQAGCAATSATEPAGASNGGGSTLGDGSHRLLEAAAASVGPAVAEAVAGGEESQPSVSGGAGAPYSLPAALALYGLTHSELLWERRLNTKALVGWSKDTVVIAFRGTASWANVWADIRFCRVPFPSRTGHWWLATRPLVHAGFLASWTVNGFNKRLLDRLRGIVAANSHAPGYRLKVVVTGHSLGGALALLAAYDIQHALSSQCPLEVACYTFGAPRTGNHAFASEYTRTVPDTWHIINDQDAVARGGKLVCLYKRPAQRVLINGGGDLIVRPSWLEASIQRTPAAYSVNHHYLRSYQKSLVAIINAQLTAKRMHGGLSGVRALAASIDLHQVFNEAAGAKLQALQQLQQQSSRRRLMPQQVMEHAHHAALPRPGWLHGSAGAAAGSNDGGGQDVALTVIDEAVVAPCTCSDVTQMNQDCTPGPP